MQTANFKRNPEREFQLLDQFQPNKPNMVAEFWTGWFDHWMGPVHAHTTVEGYLNQVQLFARCLNHSFDRLHQNSGRDPFLERFCQLFHVPWRDQLWFHERS